MTAAHSVGMSRIELTVHVGNHPAIALYKKVGFKEEGVLREKTLIDGSYIDSIMMAAIKRPA